MSMMKQFRQMVDAKVQKIGGVGLSDLADFDLWAYFPEDASCDDEYDQAAHECAMEILTDNGFLFDDDYDDSMDGDHASGLASAGMGTDEDYGDWNGDYGDF